MATKKNPVGTHDLTEAKKSLLNASLSNDPVEQKLYAKRAERSLKRIKEIREIERMLGWDKPHRVCRRECSSPLSVK